MFKKIITGISFACSMLMAVSVSAASFVEEAAEIQVVVLDEMGIEQVTIDGITVELAGPSGELPHCPFASCEQEQPVVTAGLGIKCPPGEYMNPYCGCMPYPDYPIPPLPGS